MTSEVDLTDSSIETLYRRSRMARARRAVLNILTVASIGAGIVTAVLLIGSLMLHGVASVRAETCERVGVELELETRYEGPYVGCIVELEDGGNVPLENYRKGD